MAPDQELLCVRALYLARLLEERYGRDRPGSWQPESERRILEAAAAIRKLVELLRNV